MFSTVWHALFFDPIYNLLIFILNHVPGGDLGVAIIVLTVLIKLVLLPLSLRAAKTQYAMRTLEPELAVINEKYKTDAQQRGKATMDLYRTAGVNPFASFLLQIIQLPFIFALYFAVSRGGGIPFPDINTALLYSFIPLPDAVTMVFIGLINIAAKNWPLAVLAGLAQFVHTKLSLPPLPPRAEGKEQSFKDDFARSMQVQMRYIMPVLIGYIAYRFSATIALYFLISSITAILQEMVVRRHLHRDSPAQKD
ncbi:YidC/Oxa1 family membrane protein insertase [Candidatus Kaiserbacteria bacterium]|nr:YidC/Oxa1 family membrane protein insertase [Candidatus Kaiserbacteria bacterium]